MPVTRRQRQRRPNGGGLIDQGARGCGFVPALRCKGNTEAPNTGLMSKFMRKSTYLVTELEMANLLASLDPTQQYTLYATKSCDVNPNNVKAHEANFRTCRIANPPKQESQQKASHDPLQPFDPFLLDNLLVHVGDYSLLQIPYGGTDLLTYMNNLQHLELPPLNMFVPLFQTGIPNLLEGLRHLHAGGFYHMDIKLENTVFDGRLLRYIDYDLSTTRANVGKRFATYSPFYFLYPPEMHFTWMKPAALNALTDEDIQTRVNIFYDRTVKNARIPADLYWNPDGSPKLDVPFVRTHILPVVRQKVAAGDYAYLAEKADVYGLGLLLYTTVTFMFGLQIQRGRVYEWRDGAWVDLSDMRTPKTSIQRQKVQYIRAFIVKLVNICYAMMSPATETRMTLTEALAAYEGVLAGLGSLTPPQDLVVGEKRRRNNLTEAEVPKGPNKPKGPNGAKETKNEEEGDVGPPLKRQKTRRQPRGRRA